MRSDVAKQILAIFILDQVLRGAIGITTPIHELVHVVLAKIRGDKVESVDWLRGRTIVITTRRRSKLEIALEEAFATLVEVLCLYPVMKFFKLDEKIVLKYTIIPPLQAFLETLRS